MEASVNQMHNLERRCILSRPGNFNSIWQLLVFKITPSLFLVIGRGGGGALKSMAGWLAEIGWRCYVDAWSVSTSKF